MESGFRIWWGSKVLTVVLSDADSPFIIDDEGEITPSEPTERQPMGFAPLTEVL